MMDFKDKIVLVVNIASMCGYTAKNNKFIAALAKKYQDHKDFVILAFPCSQFGGQEYSDAKKICDSHMDGLRDCKECIGKNLILMQKVDVNGDTAHPLFKFMRLHSPLLDQSSGKVDNIPWNYCKFLIDRQGTVKQFFKSGDLKDVEVAIDGLLAPGKL
jgi:glutathione peroxidase-family protein